MSLKDEFRNMVNELTTQFALPPIANIFFPPFYKGSQPKDAQFMAISLEGGATGISFVLLPDEKMEEYTALQPPDFVEKNPRGFALEFGNDDPIKGMIGLVPINAICQQVMGETVQVIKACTAGRAVSKQSFTRNPIRVLFLKPLATLT